MAKVKDKYLTKIYSTRVNKDQIDYFLSEFIHGIYEARIDGKKVNFEVILSLKEVPKNYGHLVIFVRQKGIFRRRG